MKLGELVKKYRQEHSLTVREFATKSGVSHGYIAMLENGKNSKTGLPITPSLVMLNKIANGMSLSIDELISTIDDMPVVIQPSPVTPESISPNRQKLIDFAMSVPDDKVEPLYQALQAILAIQK